MTILINDKGPSAVLGAVTRPEMSQGWQGHRTADLYRPCARRLHVRAGRGRKDALGRTKRWTQKAIEGGHIAPKPATLIPNAHLSTKPGQVHTSQPVAVKKRPLRGGQTQWRWSRASGVRLWLSCDWCQHSAMVDVRAFAAQHGHDMRTPLLTISRALKCTRCGERRNWCRLGPNGYGMRR